MGRFRALWACFLHFRNRPQHPAREVSIVPLGSIPTVVKVTVPTAVMRALDRNAPPDRDRDEPPAKPAKRPLFATL